MLRSAKEIMGYTLSAKDGKIGSSKDFLFDDKFWTVRYLVANTGKWLFGRTVLISPISLGRPGWDTQEFSIRLTKAQIEDAPGLEEGLPVSRQHEIEFFKHYDWPAYWGGAYPWGGTMNPMALYNDKEMGADIPPSDEPGDKDLRSMNEVLGYGVETTDGQLGHVEDFLLDDDNWVIRYLIIDTRNWLPGKKVIVSPNWMEDIQWPEEKIQVGMTQQQLKDAPEFEPGEPIKRSYEEELHNFYGRPKYWS